VPNRRGRIDRPKGKGRHAARLVVALLIVALSVLLWYLPKEYAYRRQLEDKLLSKDGVFDLRGIDFQEDIVLLGGAVEYVPDVLLTPEQFDSWAGKIFRGPVPKDMRVATARITLLVPEDMILAMASDSVDYNERVFVNGQWRREVGSPGPTPETSVPGLGFRIMEVREENGVVTIIRQSSNFVHKENSSYAGFWVGSPANIYEMTSLVQLFTGIGMGLCLCLFILHIAFYLLLSRYKPNLWFALLCLIWLLRTGVSGRMMLLAAFPGIPWAPLYRLGVISVAATGVLLLLLIRDQFPGMVHRRVLQGFLIAQGTLSLFYLLWPDTVLITEVKVASEALLLLAGVYLAVRAVRVLPVQWRMGEWRIEHTLTLVGIGAALVTSIHDAMRYNNLPVLFNYVLGDVGIILLLLLQAAALLLASLRQLSEARQNARLAWEHTELARKQEKLALLEAENLRRDLELRRQFIASIGEGSLITCGLLTLNTKAFQAFCRDEDLLLTPKEFAMLLYFTQHQGETVSREALYEEVWQQPFTATDRALHSHLYRLRKKLEISDCAIENVRGVGYCFEVQSL